MMELVTWGDNKRKADDSSSSEESFKKPRTGSESSDSETTEGEAAPTLKHTDDATTSEDGSTASHIEKNIVDFTGEDSSLSETDSI